MASLRAVATAATCWPRRLCTRRKKLRSGPGERAAAQPASTSMPRACPRDPPMVCRSRSGLPHTRVQPEIADQLLGFGKALDITDGGDQGERYDHINAGDGHQALHPFIA